MDAPGPDWHRRTYLIISLYKMVATIFMASPPRSELAHSILRGGSIPLGHRFLCPYYGKPARVFPVNTTAESAYQPWGAQRLLAPAWVVAMYPNRRLEPAPARPRRSSARSADCTT